MKERGGAKPFLLDETAVKPGTRKLIRLPVARVPTGETLHLPVHVLHGKAPGPAAFVSAALHGDELGGIAALRQLLEVLEPSSINGTLLVVPVINGFGVINASRYLPDRRDLNRSFPGSLRGSLTGRLAHLFLNKVVLRCDFGIDLHCGSGGRANLPQVRANLDDPFTRELAVAFGGPLRLHAKVRKGTLRGAATQRGTAVLLHEAGEAHRLNRIPVRAAAHGVLRVLAAQAIWDGSPPTYDGPSHVSRRSRWVRANRSGICEITANLGDAIKRGEPFARIYDPSSMDTRVIKSTHDGLVIGVLREALVYQGDALVHIAEVEPVA